MAAGLLSRAVGKQLTCVFVDHGLLRKKMKEMKWRMSLVLKSSFELNFIRVNAKDRYYKN